MIQGTRNQSKKEAIAIVSCAGQRKDVAARQREKKAFPNESYKQNDVSGLISRAFHSKSINEKIQRNTKMF